MPVTNIDAADFDNVRRNLNTLPALGQAAKAGSLPVATASDDAVLALFGPVTETAPATDTASSGLNGRLQRAAQRLTSLIALVPASLGQKAKAASFAVTLASDDDSLALFGPVTETAPATDTASSGLNGRLQRIAQRLTSLLTGIILAAGENHIGAVGGTSVVVGASFTRPADTTAYAIGDLIANNTTAGSVTPIPAAAARINAGTGVVRRIRVTTSNASLSGSEIVRVHLFKASPTVTNGDNGAFAANGVTSLALGFTDVVLNHVYNDGSKGFATVDIVFDAAGGSQNIYGLIEARTAFTPSSAATWTLAVEVLQD